MVLYGTIAGTGLAIVRLLVSWCVCGDDNKNTDSDRNSPEARRGDYVLNPGRPLDSWSVLPNETENHAGGKYYVNGNHSPDDPKNSADNGTTLNANQYPVSDKSQSEHRVQREEKKVDSKTVSDDSGFPNDSASNHRSAFRISGGEGVKDTAHRLSASDALDDAVGRIFPASNATTLGLPVPFLISPKSILQGLPANPHTDKPTNGHRKETTSSLTFGEPKTKDFRHSGESAFDPPNLFSPKKPPTKTSGVWPLEQKKGGKDVKPFSTLIYKASSAGGSENQVPTLDINGSSSSLNNAPQAASTAPKPFTRVSNDELTKKNILPSTFDFQVAQHPTANVAGKLKEEKSNLKPSNVLGPVEVTPCAPYTTFGNPRRHRIAFAPEIVVITPRNKKTNEESDISNRIPLDPAGSHLNPRQSSVGKVSLGCEGADLVKIEKATSSTLGELSPGRSFPAPGPHPLGGARNIGTTNRKTGTRIPGPTESRVGPSWPMFQTRQISIPRAKKINTPPEEKSLNFTPGRNFRNPSHFPQKPPVFLRISGNQPKSTKIFESATEEAADVLGGKKRILQNGSLKRPLVGRVKLVSKAAGKDPGFTYATWAKAGSKRSRGVHICQEERGCRVCD